jgi:hypothetical protein
MLLMLPASNPAHTADLTDARHTFERAGLALGNQELAAAGRILLGLRGENAARLLSVMDTDDDGNPAFTALLLFGRDGILTWFNHYTVRYDCWDYPGADALSDDRDRPLIDFDESVLHVVELHLEYAYTAFGGLNGALDTTTDAFFTAETNLMEFSVDEALTAVTPRPTDADPHVRLPARPGVVHACRLDL